MTLSEMLHKCSWEDIKPYIAYFGHYGDCSTDEKAAAPYEDMYDELMSLTPRPSAYTLQIKPYRCSRDKAFDKKNFKQVNLQYKYDTLGEGWQAIREEMLGMEVEQLNGLDLDYEGIVANVMWELYDWQGGFTIEDSNDAMDALFDSTRNDYSIGSCHSTVKGHSEIAHLIEEKLPVGADSQEVQFLYDAYEIESISSFMVKPRQENTLSTTNESCAINEEVQVKFNRVDEIVKWSEVRSQYNKLCDYWIIITAHPENSISEQEYNQISEKLQAIAPDSRIVIHTQTGEVLSSNDPRAVDMKICKSERYQVEDESWDEERGIEASKDFLNGVETDTIKLSAADVERVMKSSTRHWYTSVMVNRGYDVFIDKPENTFSKHRYSYKQVREAVVRIGHNSQYTLSQEQIYEVLDIVQEAMPDASIVWGYGCDENLATQDGFSIKVFGDQLDRSWESE